MSEETKDSAAQPNQTAEARPLEVMPDKDELSAKEMIAMAEAVQPLMLIWKEMQETEGKNGLEHARIEAKVTTKFIYGVFGVLAAFAVLAGACLYLDKVEATQQIVTQVFIFLGGVGVGKLWRGKS